MKFAILNDTHCGARNSSELFIEYQRQFYEEVFFPYLIKNGIKDILHLGDYYEHRKFINFKALNANRNHFLNRLREYGMNMTIIPGNHDVFYKNTNDLCSLKELLGHFTDCVDIVQKPKVYDYDGVKVALIPWINSENYASTMTFIDECGAQYCGAHLELVGFDMMKGVTNTHGSMTAEPFKKFDQVWTGHFHTKSTNGNINYLGSQMEFTWADCDDPKHFHIFDTETHQLTPVLNPITLFTKIVYNDKEVDYNNVDCEQYSNRFIKVIVQNKQDLFTFDKFIDRLISAGAHEVKIAETFDQFAGENVEVDVEVEDTITLMDSYVDSAETDLDKDRIKQTMQNLFTEAQNLSVI